MEEIFGIVLLTVFCLSVSYFEYKSHKTYLTPFNVMAYPYLIVVGLINLFGLHFGFFSVNIKSILFVIICLVFFKGGGIIIEKLFPVHEFDDKLFSFKEEQLSRQFNYYGLFFIVLSIISIIVSIIHFKGALASVGGWKYIATKNFENAYGKGLLSHVAQLNRPAFTFLCGYYFFSKKKYILLLLFIMFCSVLVLQIKTHIITTLFAGIIYSYMINVVKVNYRKILIYTSIIFILFNLSYILGYSRIGIQNAYSGKIQAYLIYQFFTYLFGGVIGLSKIINDPVFPMYSTKIIFAVLINFYNTINGDSRLVDVIVHYWMSVSTNYQFFHYTNVYTLFGALYMFLGTFGALLYMFFTGIVSYLLKYFAYIKNAYIGFQLAYAFYLSFLSIAFFDIYFNQLQIYHTSVLMIVLPIIFSSTRNFSKKGLKYLYSG